MTERTSQASVVRKRKVLYLSGYDPHGSGKYHHIYKKEAFKQSESFGHKITVSACTAIDAFSDHWTVQAEIDGAACETDYEFLRWDDIVAKHWHSGHANYLRMTASSTWASLKNGVLLKLCKTSLPLFSIFIYPPAWLLILVLLGLSLLATSIFLGSMLPAAWQIPSWLSLLLATATGAALIALSRHAEIAWHMGWLMRAWWFIRYQACSKWPDLDARLDAHAQRLVQILDDPQWDEVLVVGHCWGATIAVDVLSRANVLARQSLSQPRLNLLTLANCFPLLSYQPEARFFRDALQITAENLHGRWIDFTAPADRACAALVDPLLAVRHISPTTEKLARQPLSATMGPKLLTTQFHKLFEPAQYSLLHQNLYEMHFQYLKASTLKGEYDFFAITAGPLNLVQRFAARVSQTTYVDLQRFGGPFPERGTT